MEDAAMDFTSFLDDSEDDLPTASEDSNSSDGEPKRKRVKTAHEAPQSTKPRIKKPKTEAAKEKDRLAGKALLDSKKIFEMQDIDYGTDEKNAFDRVRGTLQSDADARRRLSAQIRDDVLGELLYESAEITIADRKLCEARLDTRTIPFQLFRVASRLRGTGSRCTNGEDELDRHTPAKVFKKQKHGANLSNLCAPDLLDVPHAREMLGKRFLWNDRNWDETLSWTNSLLFPLVLGSCRDSKGEQDITIYMIDVDTAQRPANRDLPTNSDTSQVRRTWFRFGPDLIRDLQLLRYKKFNHKERGKLASCWFTHEYISHHEVETKTGSRCATLPELIAAGLKEVMPELYLKDSGLKIELVPKAMRLLYDRCVYVRSRNFSSHEKHPAKISLEDIQKADKLASCFLTPSEKSARCAAPLHILLSFLGLRRRARENHDFRQWIQEHYTGADVTALHYDRSARVASNLPEQMQTLALGREACLALEVAPFRKTRVWPVDPNFNFEGLWLPPAPKKIRIRLTKEEATALALALSSTAAPAVLNIIAATTADVADILAAADTDARGTDLSDDEEGESDDDDEDEGESEDEDEDGEEDDDDTDHDE